MLNNFIGKSHFLPNNWFNIININDYKDKPINYLEIDIYYGANLLYYGETYELHKDSKLYCIGPWEDYEEYPEYKNEQQNIYESFMKNVETSGFQDKIVINRGIKAFLSAYSKRISIIGLQNAQLFIKKL